MSLKVYNTMTRSVDAFEPLESKYVRMYTCGPTVYDFAHIGNFRAYIFEDLLRRYLKFSGYEVTQVMNLTDVDDKTIRGSQAVGLPLREFTQKFKDAFFEDIELLGIERAEYYPAATDHIGNMIAIIQTLMEKGYAYQSDDRSVYFSIEKFDKYGQLAHLDMSGLRAGARVDQDEYDKDNAADFALWKAWDEKDGDVAWPSPWGKGRPGWHIECSAMSMKYLGESFDIHTGGVDNIFPHHEDEIAQSEAATGKPFAKYWLHCAHLIVEGKKMSKSLGNFFTLRQIFDKGYSGREVRYVLISTHYRQALNFTFAALDAARVSIRRLDEFAQRLQDLAGDDVSAQAFPAFAEEARQAFCAALDDDLNVSEALAAVFDMVRKGHKSMDEGALNAGQAVAVLALLNEFDQIFQVLEADAEQEVDDEAERILALRNEARGKKDWAEADRLRDELTARGWMVQDAADGAKLKRM